MEDFEDIVQNRLEQHLPSVLREYPHAYTEAVQNSRSEPSLEALLDMPEEQMAALYTELGEDFQQAATPPAVLMAGLTGEDAQRSAAISTAISSETHIKRASRRLVEGYLQDRRLVVVAVLGSVVMHAALAFGLASLLPKPALERAEPEIEVEVHEVHKDLPSSTASARASLKGKQEHTPVPPSQQNHTHQKSVQSKPPLQPPVSNPVAVVVRLQPEYPEEAIQNDWEGTVLLDAYILPNGLVGKVRTAQTSQHTVLDVAGETALWQWRFYPARRNNKNVGTWVRLSFAFVLVDPVNEPTAETFEGQPVVLNQEELASVALSLPPVPVPPADLEPTPPDEPELEGFTPAEEPMCLIPL